MASTPKPRFWNFYEGQTGWLRGFLITLAAAVFMTVSQAFHSNAMTFPSRFAYWLGLMTVGWVWGVIVSNLFFGDAARPKPIWRRVFLSALVIAIPYSVVVGVATHFARGSRFNSLAEIADLLESVLMVTAAMITINVLVARQSRATTSASSSPPRFLDRLPAKLRGAELWGVEAEDHYLRLHTSLGQDLILMRLSDALDELEGIEGAQVHRSWWVARQAVTQAVRGDGRATLTLKDGSQVPVSRTYARLLRARNWI